MEKYQLYRTALDALQFLIVSELGFEHSDKLALGHLFEKVSSSVSDSVSDVIFKAIEDVTKNA